MVLGVSLVAMIAACKQPVVGAPAQAAQTTSGARIEITGARVDTLTDGKHVVATLRITRGGIAVGTLDEVAALQPMFTLAGLSTHPGDGLSAWRSFLRTGAQTIPSLPLNGVAATATTVLTKYDLDGQPLKQPGAESAGTWAGADGTFTYTYANALPAGCPAAPAPRPNDRMCFDPAETLRAGVWLQGAGTVDGTSTYDFRPDGGTAAPRDVALHQSCQTCHDAVRSHDGAVGVKICTTCHTWQNADPDTADPAAQYPASKAVDPNPLDLGRLVHRIHRGKDLPTLYARSNLAAAGPLGPPPYTSASPPPRPFERWAGGVPVFNAAIVGRKYSIVGFLSRERIFGQVLNDYPADPTLTPRAVPAGGVFPRDLRDCVVCHQGAPQSSQTIYAISRRTCSGCHPEAWYGSAAVTDNARFPHLGGPQADDTACVGCHVSTAGTSQPKVYAPIAEIHVPPNKSPRYNKPTITILSVDSMKPGMAPTIRFRIEDRDGPVTPKPSAPTQLTETGPYPSPTPRKMTTLSLTLSGPTAPGYWGYPVLSGDVVTPPNPVALNLTADPDGAYTYQFSSMLPATATGTWVVGMDGRRRYTAVIPPATTAPAAGVPLPFYDVASDRFLWPYTAEIEAPTEQPNNPLVYVDTATGSWTKDAPGAAVPRRVVVSQEKCERCHEHFRGHGGQRENVQYCLVCHNPYRTDFLQRQAALNTPVVLANTFDGLEERSIDMKVMIHRFHSGGREGSASLEAIEPLVVYGVGKSPFWFADGAFPGDLRKCTTCHEGQSYRIDVMPADAPPTIGNETSTIMHAQGQRDHSPGEPAMLPIHAACVGCHATGFTDRHAVEHTVDGVEQCASCHLRGASSVDVAHGLAPESAPLVSASFSSIAQNILVPRCASAACHGGNPPAAFPRLDAEGAYDAIVGVDSQQASGVKLVQPFDPGASYLYLKLTGEAASVGGIATLMPTGDAALDASDLAAVEAWIANGAPND
jgi:OmcA/MtrC family decaheme c-type cytochrome